MVSELTLSLHDSETGSTAAAVAWAEQESTPSHRGEHDRSFSLVTDDGFGDRRPYYRSWFTSKCEAPIDEVADVTDTGSASSADWTHQTTLMIRNIARTSTQYDFIDALDSLENSRFRGRYDFAYLPFRACRRRNLGFAFVNFVHSADAKLFYETCHRSPKFTHRGTRSRHVTISVAKVQGQAENVRLIQETIKRNKDNLDHRPVAFVINSVIEFAI